jgi:hypothetical protein
MEIIRALLNEEYLTTEGSVNATISQQVGGVERVTKWRVERNRIISRYLPRPTSELVFSSGVGRA